MADGSTRGGYVADFFSKPLLPLYAKTIDRCPRSPDIVRFMPMGHIGVNFAAELFGDTMTWDQFASLGLGYGNNFTVTYLSPQPGWKYEYDALGKVFHVIDAQGNDTKKKITSISDFEITQDILDSHQFRVYFAADYEGSPVLEAWIGRRNRGYENWPVLVDDTISPDAYVLAYIDQFFSDAPFHWRCRRLVRELESPNEPEDELTQELDEPQPLGILRSKVPARHTTGDYRQVELTRLDDLKAGLLNKRRNAAISLAWGEFFMIAFFATLMNMTKPVVEPWMLWNGLWRWAYHDNKWDDDDGDGDLDPDMIFTFDMPPRW